jgi:hypothetical protein
MSVQLIIEVPDALAAQVAVALRATYPDIALPTMTDGQATRAVIAWWTASTLANYQVERVRKAKQAVVDKAQADMQASVVATSAAAWKAVSDAMAPPVGGTVDPNTPTQEGA